MNDIKNKIKERVREKIHPRAIEKYDLLKADIKKRFTMAWLFFLGAVLIFQGIVRLVPYLIDIPEYVGFFAVGGLVLIFAVFYTFRNKKKLRF